MSEYQYVTEPGEGLVILLHPRYGEQIWARKRIRRRQVSCRVIGNEIPAKTEVYGPVTNCDNRGDVISLSGMEQLKQRRQ